MGSCFSKKPAAAVPLPAPAPAPEEVEEKVKEVLLLETPATAAEPPPLEEEFEAPPVKLQTEKPSPVTVDEKNADDAPALEKRDPSPGKERMRRRPAAAPAHRRERSVEVVSGIGCRSGRFGGRQQNQPSPSPGRSTKSDASAADGVPASRIARRSLSSAGGVASFRDGEAGEASGRRFGSPGTKRRTPARPTPASGAGESGRRREPDNPSVSMECFIFL